MDSYRYSPPFLIIFQYLIFFFLFKISSSSPLSLCTKGTFSYIKDSSINSKTCNLNSDLSDAFPAAVNSAFFSSSEKCGICYEMVGPFGAVKIRVEDKTEDSNSDETIPHFKLGVNATFSLLGLNSTDDLSESRKISVSLRMISCGYSNNINIITGEDNYEGYVFSCLVLNSNIAISSVRMKENGGSSFIKLERNSNNYFSYDKGDLINYPINIRIGSITGEIANITLSSKESDETHESDGNFANSEGSYYTIDTLKKEKDITEIEQCCSVDYSSFSSIYTNGELDQNYERENYNSTITISETMDISFSNYGKLIIKSKMPIRADQFIGVSLSLKGNKICRECLYISAYGKSTDIKIQITSIDNTKSYQYFFSNLGVESNTFNGIVLYTKGASIDISINNILLVENSNAPSTEICLGNKTDWTPIVPVPDKEDKTTETIETIETTSIYSTIVINNGTEKKIEINIKNISLINSTFISIKSENFSIKKNESIILNFSSPYYNFQTIECLFNSNTNYTDSFNCQIPNILNVSNGDYIVQTISDNIYHINNSEKINITNGNLIYNYTPIIVPIPIPTIPHIPHTQSPSIINTINITETIIPTQEINNEIVIINSMTRSINKGDSITFQINPIETRQYNQIDQIILIDNNSQTKNALYLKNCKNNIINNKTTSISCVISNNILKGNYSSLASGQNIKISDGQKINLISYISTGGVFSQDMNQTINANISRRMKNNYTLTFKITYYGQNLKPKDIFPYSVYLSGIKKLRNLLDVNYEVSYNSQIQFPNCSMGNYSSNNSQAIEGITCHLPNFIPAGTYTKLSSEGFDVNPNNKINLDFPYDFNKSENYLSKSRNSTTYYNNDEGSSSSKTWIIWVVLGILVAILAAVIIIALCVNKKRKMNADDNNVNNESGANQINNSNEVNLDDNSNKNNKNDNNINNTISKSGSSEA